MHGWLALLSGYFILQKHVFVKADIPEHQEGKAELAKKLMPFKVSLIDYAEALKQEELR